MRDLLHKTLIIRFSSIGDIVLSSPLVRTLRRHLPDAQIDFLIKEEYAELMEGNPHLSRLLIFPRNGSLAHLREVRRQVHAEGYDLILDIHDSLRSRYITFPAQHVVRVNKRKLPRALMVHLKVNTYPWFGGAPGVAQRYFETVRDFEVHDDGLGPEVFPSDRHTKRAAASLEGVNGALFGLAPGARHWSKMWPQERYAEAAVALAKRFRASIALFGSADDLERCGWIEQRIRAAEPSAHVLNLAGSLSLMETAAALDRCSALLTNDTGLMHLATARNRPVVAIFGPTVREFGFYPLGGKSLVLDSGNLPCRPCTHIGRSYCPKDHFRCMLDIPAKRAADAVAQLLAQ